MLALSSCAEEGGGEVSRGTMRKEQMDKIESHFKVIPFQLFLLSLQVDQNGRQRCPSNTNQKSVLP